MGQKSLTKEEIEIIIKKPKLYKVIMHNDDYTTMEFVVDILTGIFNKTSAEATKIMLDVHKKGSGVAGIYSYDIASTKINHALREAKSNGFPLKLSLKEE